MSSEWVQPPTNSGRFHAPAISAPSSVPWVISSLSIIFRAVIVLAVRCCVLWVFSRKKGERAKRTAEGVDQRGNCVEKRSPRRLQQAFGEGIIAVLLSLLDVLAEPAQVQLVQNRRTLDSCATEKGQSFFLGNLHGMDGAAEILQDCPHHSKTLPVKRVEYLTTFPLRRADHHCLELSSCDHP